MAGEMRPLSAVTQDLKVLVGQKASGIMFIVTEDDRAAWVRLLDGRIEEVRFRNRYNDEAVQLLSQVRSMRARFQPQPSAALPSKHPALGESAIRWLLGDREDEQFAAPSPPPPTPSTSSSAVGADQSAAQWQIVEKIALSYFGPIATLLCEEALANSKDVHEAVHQIAANLSGPDEARRFETEVLASLARST